MKKIGIVGGTAWLSTVDYYSMLCELGRKEGCNPEFSIESLDLSRAVSYIGEVDDSESWRSFDSYHRDALLRVEASGAQVAFLAANTPHHRFDAITRDVGIPVVNLYDAVAEACSERGIHRVLVLGTSLTMTSPVMRERFARAGVTVDVPPPERQSEIVSLIEALQYGDAPNAANKIEAVSRAQLEAGRVTVALACTELPLAFPVHGRLPFFEVRDIRYVNTLAVHARAIFDRAR
jgi:aspartate racemase